MAMVCLVYTILYYTVVYTIYSESEQIHDSENSIKTVWGQNVVVSNIRRGLVKSSAPVSSGVACVA
jgi:hypothetical protein